MNIISIIGLLSSVVGIIGWLLPISTQNPRLQHLAYGVFIVLLSASTVWYFEAYSRTKQVENAADKLVQTRTMSFTHEGFILASLAFLEKNKDLYPESYERAKIICERNNCVPTQSLTETIHIAYALEGLVKGIGTLESE